MRKTCLYQRCSEKGQWLHFPQLCPSSPCSSSPLQHRGLSFSVWAWSCQRSVPHLFSSRGWISDLFINPLGITEISMWCYVRRIRGSRLEGSFPSLGSFTNGTKNTSVSAPHEVHKSLQPFFLLNWPASSCGQSPCQQHTLQWGWSRKPPQQHPANFTASRFKGDFFQQPIGQCFPTCRSGATSGSWSPWMWVAGLVALW